MAKDIARSHGIRRIFLSELEKGFSESKAAKAAGVSLRFMRKWRDEDENLRLDWDDATEAGNHKLEDVARNRAVKKSDALLTTLLKARMPEKYRDNSSVELKGKVDVTGDRERLHKKLLEARATAAGRAGEN